MSNIIGSAASGVILAGVCVLMLRTAAGRIFTGPAPAPGTALAVPVRRDVVPWTPPVPEPMTMLSKPRVTGLYRQWEATR